MDIYKLKSFTTASSHHDSPLVFKLPRDRYRGAGDSNVFSAWLAPAIGSGPAIGGGTCADPAASSRIVENR